MGDDVDVLSWNSGMTDKDAENVRLYFYRGAVLKNRPVLWGHDATGYVTRSVGPDLETRGLSIFGTEYSIDGFPDVMPEGIPISAEESAKLTRFVNNVKCNNKGCSGPPDKWSCTRTVKETTYPNCTCPNVKARSSWHPGFRVHAMKGHSMALGIMQMLLESLEELAASSRNTKSLLEELQAEEDQLFEEFLQTPITVNGRSGDDFTSVGNTSFLHHLYTGMYSLTKVSVGIFVQIKSLIFLK